MRAGDYPKRVAHPEIPLGSGILSVVDAYHAMRSVRPFLCTLTHEEAIEELRRCRGTQFDPNVVEAFLQCLRTGNSCSEED